MDSGMRHTIREKTKLLASASIPAPYRTNAERGFEGIRLKPRDEEAVTE